MQIDLETVRWLLTGVFFVSGALMTWALSRAVGAIDKRADDHEQRIKENTNQITKNQIEVATNYVSKIDLEKQLETHLSPIRDDMRDIKDDLKTLLKRP